MIINPKEPFNCEFCDSPAVLKEFGSEKFKIKRYVLECNCIEKTREKHLKEQQILQEIKELGIVTGKHKTHN